MFIHSMPTRPRRLIINGNEDGRELGSDVRRRQSEKTCRPANFVCGDDRDRRGPCVDGLPKELRVDHLGIFQLMSRPAFSNFCGREMCLVRYLSNKLRRQKLAAQRRTADGDQQPEPNRHRRHGARHEEEEIEDALGETRALGTLGLEPVARTIAGIRKPAALTARENPLANAQTCRLLWLRPNTEVDRCVTENRSLPLRRPVRR
jgi:hypothetical protein